jgi:hypothetical protein
MALKGKTPTKAQFGRQCAVCAAIEEMDKDDAETLIEWMSNPSISFPAISKVLKEDPDVPELTISSLQRHTTGLCSNGVAYR